MDKIYSRKRIIIPKIFKSGQNFRGKNNKNYGKLFKIIVIVTIAIVVALWVINAIEPILNRQCVNMAKSIATQISNEQATVVMEKYKYEDLINIIRDENGEVKMITSNVIPINEIISNVPIKIQEQLNNKEDGRFEIALGSFTGSKLLSGRGPKVKIQMSTIGSVETTLVSDFQEAGINQTLHRIYLDVGCTVAVLTPYTSYEEKIVNQVLIAEAVIVGNVPTTYYNLDGLKSNDSLEVIN